MVEYATGGNNKGVLIIPMGNINAIAKDNVTAVGVTTGGSILVYNVAIITMGNMSASAINA